MCWYIYGALQGDVEAEALNAVNNRHTCHMVKDTTIFIDDAFYKFGKDGVLIPSN